MHVDIDGPRIDAEVHHIGWLSVAVQHIAIGFPKGMRKHLVAHEAPIDESELQVARGTRERRRSGITANRQLDTICCSDGSLDGTAADALVERAHADGEFRAEHRFDAAFGGARRDEERARAKERIFSFRDDFGQWDPRAQRPELWSLYNGRVRRGEHVRVFPIANWPELDVWEYIEREELEIPSIYYAHEREVFARDGMLYAASEFVSLADDEQPFTTSVRYRTVGDMSCTGAVRSGARTLTSVVTEIAATTITERGETRADDRVSEAAMEDRKREGYF